VEIVMQCDVVQYAVSEKPPISVHVSVNREERIYAFSIKH